MNVLLDIVAFLMLVLMSVLCVSVLYGLHVSIFIEINKITKPIILKVCQKLFNK